MASSTYRRGTSTSDSLPRSPSSLAPPVPERRFSSSRPTKLTKSSENLDSEDHKKTLQSLNDRLVSYVEKVRKLQSAADVIDSHSRSTESDESVRAVKAQYVAEISGWRVKYEEAQSLLAQLKIELANLKTDNRQLNLKVEDKMGALRERDQTIGTMEAEIAEVISKLNLLQSEKGRLIQNESVYKSDISDLKSELEAAKRELDRERVRGSELEAKLGSLDQDMAFQIKLLTTELDEERRRNKVDFSAIDMQLKSEYEKRLRAELAKLRRMYEEETEKAKKEFMYLHSTKVTELQEQLSEERSSNSGTKGEMKGVLERVDQLKRMVERLEADKLSLEQGLGDTRAKLEEQGQSFRAQMNSKDSEIKLLLKEIHQGKAKYEQLVEVRLALEMEINTYRSILEDEEKRIRRVSRKFSKTVSNSGRGGRESDSEDSNSDQQDVTGYRSVDSPDGRRTTQSSYSYASTARVTRK